MRLQTHVKLSDLTSKDLSVYYEQVTNFVTTGGKGKYPQTTSDNNFPDTKHQDVHIHMIKLF